MADYDWNQDRVFDFIFNYKPKTKIRTEFSPDTNSTTDWASLEVPKALFFSEYSLGSEYVLIYPRFGPWNYTLGWDGNWNNKEHWLRAQFPDYDIVNVLASDGKTILYLKIRNIGEGMAKAKEVILSNGDTLEWTRLDFET